MSVNSSENKQPFLVQFYDPEIKGRDARGRDLDTMLTWSDNKLEQAHDYIQIWFPLPEGSPFNWEAPVIDRATFSAFRSRRELRANLQRAFTRILKFYGFDVAYEEDYAEITRSENHLQAFRNWVVRMDHNHLRITRIIRSLRVLGLEQNAHVFHRALRDVSGDYPNRIGQRTMMFWERAAVRALYLAPDQADNAPITSPRFLRDIEEEPLRKLEGSVSKVMTGGITESSTEGSATKDVEAEIEPAGEQIATAESTAGEALSEAVANPGEN